MYMSPDVERIAEGMPVFDAKGSHVGKVSLIHLSDETTAKPGAETITTTPVNEDTNSMVGVLSEALVTDPTENLPEELRERLRRYGYIRIDPGMFRADKFAILEDIAFVAGDRVTLRVTSDQLVQV